MSDRSSASLPGAAPAPAGPTASSVAASSTTATTATTAAAAAAAPGPPEVLRFEGELTLENVGAFRDRVFTAIGRRPARLCLDLSACEFVDTSGLAALVTVTRVALRVHVPLWVVPAAHLRRVLAISGLIRFIPVAPCSSAVDQNTAA